MAQPDADLVPGAPLSDEDRLTAIRAHADVSMRYYATAFLRETEENRELMQAYMGLTANILALLERDALDDRSMMTGRGEIIQQYIEQARSRSVRARELQLLRRTSRGGLVRGTELQDVRPQLG
jgi:hypothetical protein